MPSDFPTNEYPHDRHHSTSSFLVGRGETYGWSVDIHPRADIGITVDIRYTFIPSRPRRTFQRSQEGLSSGGFNVGCRLGNRTSLTGGLVCIFGTVRRPARGVDLHFLKCSRNSASRTFCKVQHTCGTQYLGAYLSLVTGRPRGFTCI